MPDPKHGLGRGLDQLLPAASWLKANDIQLFYCPIERLRPNPRQPRHSTEDAGFPELVASIRAKGILQPILVTPTDQPQHYQILAGERRWRAAQAAGLTEVPVLVRTASNAETLELALIENIQRSNLTCIEEARAYHQLQTDFQLTQEQIAARVGKDRSTIANLLRLLQLPASIQDDLLGARLSMGHARALLALTDSAAQEALRHQILSQGLSVRETERRVRSGLPASQLPSPPSPHWQHWQQALSARLGARVRLRHSRHGPTLAITVGDEAALEQLLHRLGIAPDPTP